VVYLSSSTHRAHIEHGDVLFRKEKDMKTQEKTVLHWRSIMRHYWPFVRRYARLNLWTFIAYGITALVGAVAIPLIYKEMMDGVANSQALAADTVLMLVALLVAATVLHRVAHMVGDYSVTRAQGDALKELVDYTLSGLYEKSYSFYVNSFAGGLVTKVKRFVRAFEVLHDQTVFQAWMQGLKLVASAAVLAYFSLTLAGIFLVWLILYGMLVRVLVKVTLPKSLANAASDSKVTGHLADIITNMLTVKAFGTATQEQQAFEVTSEEQRVVRERAWMQNGFWNSLFQGGAMDVFNAVTIIVVLMLWQSGIADAGLVLLVLIYLRQSFDIVWNLGRQSINIITALTEANEMVEILDAPADVRDPAVPEPLGMHEGRIELRDVTLTYDNAGHVFSGLDLSIAPGERVALVGHSGAGKSTIVKLLLRFVDVSEGAVVIDGQDVRNVRQDEYRARIAYVPQEPALFHRTLFENIAYGKPEARQEEVEEAARRAHAHEFIHKLPQGYDTLVGERGVKLSGGERQRVAIARALLKDAPIVVLDEATSSLDSVSERLIQAAFDELMAGRTTIVIAHRLSTIRHMDRIVVLEHGSVAEQGTHDELLRHGGIYAELWASQVGGFIPEETQQAA